MQSLGGRRQGRIMDNDFEFSQRKYSFPIFSIIFALIAFFTSPLVMWMLSHTINTFSEFITLISISIISALISICFGYKALKKYENRNGVYGILLSTLAISLSIGLCMYIIVQFRNVTMT